MRRYVQYFYIFCFSIFKADTITTSFYSPALGDNMYYEIVIPSSYESNQDSTYPSIYFLHGFGADYSWYSSLIDKFEGMMETGEIRESFLIKLDGFVLPYLGSMYTNSEYNGQFENYIVQDLIAHIDQTYPTINLPSYRAIMGHSMGGYGAVKLAVKFPELFNVAASHAGVLAFENLITDLVPILMEETGILGFQPFSGIVSLFMFSAAAAFSPDENNLPYNVNLPLDANGNIIEDIWQLWLQHDPLTIAQELSGNLRTQQFYLDCGDQDSYLFYNHSNSFSNFLEEKNIHYNYEIYSGDHSTEILNGDRFPYSLTFIEESFLLADLLESLGDLDNDGILTMEDLTLLLLIIIQNSEPTVHQYSSGDLDFNSRVDIFDLLLLVDQI